MGRLDSGNHRTGRKHRFSSACISKDGDIFHKERTLGSAK
jgi:hypothetical protein